MATKIIGKVSIVPYGDWQENTTYPRLAVVGYQGGSYIAVVENTNITPTDTSSWKQIAAAGNGIASIEKISTVGLVDTYRITYTNGDHFDFTINNGATKTSELTNDSGFIDKDVNNLTNYLLKTDTGATIEITYDSSAYTVTANLKNSSGTVISTSTLQLPAGSSVVNASYDEEDYTITLTQRDGTEITLDLANSFNAKEDVDNKIDELNGNATEDQYPNAKITYEKVHELQEQGVLQEIQDQEIFLYDAANLPSKEIDILGNTIQNGTPTTSTPVDINIVTGDNTLVVVGKNLFDKNNVVDGKRFGSDGQYYNDSSFCASADYIVVKPNTTYKFNALEGGECLCTYDKDKQFISRTMTVGTTSKTTEVNACYARVAIYKTKKNIWQLEQGSTATPYEPYLGKSITLPLSSLELASVENVRDVLFHNVLENSYYNSSLTMGSYYKLSNIGKIASYSGETITTPYISTTGSLSTGATVYYQLSAPTYTEITDSTLIGKLNELEALSLLSGYNYIYSSATSPNANPYLNLVYIRDLNLVVDELQNIDNLLLNQSFIKNASGTMIHIEDGGNLPLKELDFEGQTSQSGTPTPDTPQDIHIVTGDNVVKVVGKNLTPPLNSTQNFNGLVIDVDNDGVTHITGTSSAAGNRTVSMNYLRLKAGTYTLSTNVVANSPIPANSFQVILKDVDSTQVIKISLWSTENKTVVLDRDYIIENWYIYTAKNMTYDFTISVQLEKNETKTTYEPYIAPTTQVIHLGSLELAKIGDYTDKLFKAVEGNSIYDSLDSTTKASLTSGSWYKQGNIKKHKISDLTWTFSTNYFFNALDDIVLETTSDVSFKGLCTAYSPTNSASYSNWASKPNYSIGVRTSTQGICIRDTDYTDATLFTNARGNEVFYYASKTPTYTEISSGNLIYELEQASQLLTYNGINNIFVAPSGTNKAPSLNLVYRQNIQDIVNKKIEEVKVDGVALPVVDHSVDIVGIGALQNEASALLDQIPVKQVSGDLINVQDSSNLSLKEIDVFGNATQATNLLTYKCVGNETGIDYYFVYDSTNYQFTMPEVTSSDFLTFNIDTKKLYKGTTEITTTTASTGTLITLSTTPNPDYPQDIHVVTGDNTLKVVGKNLFDLNAIPDYKQSMISYTTTSTGIKIKSTLTYGGVTFGVGDFEKIKGKTFTIKMTSSDIDKVSSSSFILYDKDNYASTVETLSSALGNDGEVTVTIPSTSTKNRVGFRFYLASATANQEYTINNIQVEIGSTATTYEPYTSQSITLPLGNLELAKIGDYQDKLFKAIEGDSVYDSLDSTTKGTLTSGAWYKQGNIKKVTFTGASEEGWYKLNNCFTITNSIISDIIKSNASKVFIICDQYNGITTRYRDSVIDLSICKTITGSSDVQISIKNTAYSTATEFSASLVNSPITVYYVINTPTYTQITDTTLISDLNNAEKLATYRNVTNMWIEPSGSNAQASELIIYRQDLQTLTDKIEALEARVALIE